MKAFKGMPQMMLLLQHSRGEEGSMNSGAMKVQPEEKAAKKESHV